MFCLLFASFFLVVTYIGYIFLKSLNYWKEKGVTYEPGWPILGNMAPVVSRKLHRYGLNEKLYKKHSNQRYLGYFKFLRRQVLLRDINLIKEIFVKNFDNFHDHLSFNASENDPILSKSLLRLRDEQWKQMRATVSPAFTGSKIRQMFPLIDNCAKSFTSFFQAKEKVAVEMKDVFSRYTNDVVASTAFGISLNSLKEPKNEFFLKGTRLIKFDFRVVFRVILLHFFPKIANYFKIRLFPDSVYNFFRKIIMENIRKRKENGIVRPDLIQLLMDAQKGNLDYDSTKSFESSAAVEESQIGQNNEKLLLTDDHIVSQAIQFYFSTFDTASTAAAFVAHELAVHPQIQDKLYNEIKVLYEANNRQLSYEGVVHLKYLDQVICETLRLWPPTYETDRLCTKNYTIPAVSRQEKGFEIEKGVVVILPIMAIHRDENYFPEPDRFDPERFCEDNKSKIVPGSYLPFGAGPRNCLGSRFAILLIKVLFVHLILKFKLLPTQKTKIPIKIAAGPNSLGPKNGFYLALTPRTL